jgi:hypothetical protein
MPVVISCPISHDVRDASGKVIRTLNFKRGDVVHDQADIDELTGHSHALVPVAHNDAHCPDDCAVLYPEAKVVAPVPAPSPSAPAPKVFAPHTFVPVGEVIP